MEVWISVLAGAVAIVWAFRAYERHVFRRSRVAKPLDEIYGPLQGEISRQVFDQVWSLLGKAYSIDPRYIRPSDTFAEFNRFDSWSLGKGEDEIWRWLRQAHPGDASLPKTVMDFAQRMQHSEGQVASRT